MKVVTGTFMKSEYAQLQFANTLVVIEMQVTHGRDTYKTTNSRFQSTIDFTCLSKYRDFLNTEFSNF